MPYTSQTSASELVGELGAEIAGKTILVTGPSSGSIGAVFAEAVAKAKPAQLILAARNLAKVQPVVDAIQQAQPDVKVRTLTLNLGSLADVRTAAAEVNAWDDVPVIDVLLNNAGIMAVDYALSPDGIESQFATNHVGHFLFTNLIIGKLLAAKAPRVVNVSSDGHRMGTGIRFDDYNFDGGKTYNRWRAYGQSKTANMLMALSLAEKLGSKGLLAFSLHPGVIFTNLANHLDLQTTFGPGSEQHNIELEQGNKEAQTQFEFKTPDQGAATSVYAAFHPELKAHNGAYLQDSQVADPWVHTVKPWGTSPVEAERLWKLSEKLVGQEFSY